MNVLFSRRPQHADDLLEEILSSAKARESYWLFRVITAYNELRGRVEQIISIVKSGCKNYDKSRLWRKKVDIELSKPVTEGVESSPELQLWLETFSQKKPEPMGKNKPASPMSRPDPPKAMGEVKSSENKQSAEPVWNPFPPGYAEDLLAEE